uniref:Carboxylesterase type B domain-containing protein n=2 Tax=Lutzomyia longipalpis TaxID=7200 RepID=A0A1B0CQE7_LUTLO
MLKLVFISLCVVALCLAKPATRDVSFNDRPIIHTTTGWLQGTTESCGLFCSYYSFRGIPYAAPPVGQNRFRAPQPHPGWSGTRDASEHGASCPSGSRLSRVVNEDCLFLNVYSQDLVGRRAVMVWIHGGSFSGGNGDSFTYGPDHIVDDNVVMVTINYRLGALGFLSTEDQHATGNYGLKDAIMALRWLRANIANFGGDPDNITIFGESAGGAAVHYLLLSPSARGLFHKAISQSGSALNPWAFQTNPRDVAFQLARDLGFNNIQTTEQLINTLRTVDPMRLVEATPGSMDYPIVRGIRPIPFVPSVDPPGTTGDEVFLPRAPIDIMRDGQFTQVPYITGYTSAESLVMIRELLLDPSVFPTVNANPELMVPFWWNVAPGSAAAQSISRQIADFYWNGVQLHNDIREQWTHYLTDLMFVWGIDQTVRLHASRQQQPVFYYRFSFDGSLNMIKRLTLLTAYPGAVHADDIFYLFSVTSIPPPLLPTNEAIMTRRRMEVSFNDRPIIHTTTGWLQGTTESCGLFCSYYSFKGIPYAAPPTGQNRFRAPRPHPGWSGTRDASEHGAGCPSGRNVETNTNEDCLFLNVRLFLVKEVIYLLLSPSARGLFHKAISQSGSALNPWAYQPNPREVAFQLARDLGFPNIQTTEQLINTLRTIEPSRLIQAVPSPMQYPIVRGNFPLPFVPCMDPPGTTGDEVFLPRAPIDIMRDGQFTQVPYIAGYTSAESLVMIRELLLDASVFDVVNANPELMVPYWWNVAPATAQSIARQIADFYWGGVPLHTDIREQWTHYLTDLMFVWGVDQTARMHAARQSQPVYYYRFSFDGTLNMFKRLLLLTAYPGAVHADDLFYLFSVTRFPNILPPTSDAATTRRRMVRLWTNFARFGNPTANQDTLIQVNWARMTNANEFLDIDTQLIPGSNPFQERMAFWNRLEAQYG